VTPKPTEILITGIDKQKVGRSRAEHRGFRRRALQGKGVKYAANTSSARKEEEVTYAVHSVAPSAADHAPRPARATSRCVSRDLCIDRRRDQGRARTKLRSLLRELTAIPPGCKKK